MKASPFSKFLAMMLAVVMLVSVMPMSALAAIDFNTDASKDDYYKLISKKDWELAPGIEETEIVLNNDEGSKRQVVHTVKVDMNNPYTKVIPGYKGMIPTAGNYGTESTSTQAKNAESLGYGNVVAATNAMLSWYDSAYYKANPHLVGEPLYYNILEGYYYENSQGSSTFSKSNAVVVINYDYHPVTGEKRPDDMPKVTMRPQTDPLTGWEENAIGVWAFLVKPDENGVPQNQYKNATIEANGTYEQYHQSGHESRTFVGVTADGEIILSVSDGRQAPYSTGFSMYEMADYMIKMGCIYAANCDGGGSTTFVSERPGEELKVNCSLSDGGERPTTNTFLVISTASASGEFERATLSTEYDYYTPGSSVTFNALGTDAVGTTVDVPADVTWAIKEEGMGVIENGVFTSNGIAGIVTAQMLYNGEVVGEHSITLAMPDALSFSQPVVTIPYGEKAQIPVKATLNGLYEIGLSPEDVTITSDNALLGTVDGLHFVGAATVPEENSSTVTVTLNSDPTITASTTLKLGEASVVMWDFEDGQADIDEWNSIVLRNPGEAHRDFYHELSLATKEDGQVHDGEYSMRLETNGLSSADVHSKQYAYVRLGLKDQKITLENARSMGFWLYVPEDNIQCWVQGFYKYDTNGDGTPDTLAEVNLMNSENVYYNVDESGWHYLSMDLSDFEKVDLTYSSPFDADPSDGATTGDTDEFFLVLIFHKSINNILWQTNGSINGPFTYYIDNITVDYSEAVEDREAPIFESVVVDNDGVKKSVAKHDVVTLENNVLNVVANVAEATYRTDGTGTKHTLYNYTGLDTASAKAYVDGVEVSCAYENGKMSISNLAVADGYHRVKFEICDNAGNKSTVVRLVEVESGVKASTIELVPADPALVEKDRLDFGSLFWMNMVATNIETIQSVSTVIDLNSVNHWELDHMVVADGFSADYTIDDETNTATITFTRTGTVYRAGEAVLAQLPIRMISFDTDMNIPGYTAETVWTSYTFWPHDLKVDVDKGEITYVDSYESTVLNTFSNEKFQVDTEMYTDWQSMSSDPYYTEHGTTHVHTPVVLADKAADCTDGYTGRTFCEVCNSVVEWGITLEATTAHNYVVVDGKLTCTVDGELFNGTYTDGITYYDGVAAVNGWVEIDGVKTYYYKDGAKLTGANVIDMVVYTFDENGVYLPDVDHYGFVETDNGLMFYNNNTDYITGYRYLDSESFYFDENGIAREGEYIIGGETVTFVGGQFVSAVSSDVVVAGWAGPEMHFVYYKNGDFRLSGSGYMYVPQTGAYIPWYKVKNDIKNVYVGKDVKELGRYTFRLCFNIKSITYEEGCTLEKLDMYSLYYLTAMSSVTVPESVTYIGSAAFGYMTRLKSVWLPDNVSYINENAFLKLTPGNITLCVAEGTYAHNYAVKYGFKVELRERKPVVVTSGTCGENATWTLYEGGKLVIGGSGAMTDFANRDAQPWAAYRNQITKIEIGKDITHLGKFAFAYSYNVKSVTFEEGSKLNSIGSYAIFYMYRYLTELTLPDTVTSIAGQAIAYNTVLKNMYMPQNITSIAATTFTKSPNVVLNVAEGTYAENFAVKNNIAYETRAYVPVALATGTCGANATWTLYEGGKLVIGGSGAMTDFANRDAQPWAAYRNQITEIVIGKDITHLGKFAFAYSYNVRSITFEEGSKLNSIGSYAIFYMYRYLTELILPDTVTTIAGQAIGYNTVLTDVYMPQFVSSIAANAFLNSTKVVLNVAEGTYIQSFAEKNSIAYVTREYVDAPMVSGICGTNATWELYEGGKLVIGGRGAMTDFANKDAQPWAAYRNDLTEIVIGKDITHLGKFAFAYAYNVKSVTFEEGSNLKSIGSFAIFYMYRNLTALTLPESVTTIAGQAIGYNTNLVNVSIPVDTSSIADNAFIKSTKIVLNVAEGSYAQSFAVKNGIAYVAN